MRPNDALWGEFARRLDWPTTYSHRRRWFTVYGGRPLLMRVTLGLTGSSLEAHAPGLERDAAERAWDGDLLLVGANPLPAVKRLCTDDPAAGLIGEHNGSGWTWSAAAWMRCWTCGRLALHSDLGSPIARPCGHAEGEWHTRGREVARIGRAWAQASYAVARRRTERRETP
ncbi:MULTISPECIES: hypothetical protein [Mycobacterium]|uniref:Uncharacterized protein n=1 Tax=Mycobacterium kiyosense TaxID=2871094 RepID=A0A9P3Q901_9MYCO|nr:MULTISPECIES: hypothetical protein [Mycobacterium]BDE15408.1 hypothetical protein MKCMC460_42680 [Mycobacterium sp. 20KCMC460]GLB82704.1 hypothetical protein SRL2020028_19600 [Mycobacterium kiyosense]GLB90167.1 hypothetical protein SRL2020130_29840 [Mycobacterium kiyosense]GLB95756.1 hypothetical protein SRL2020226_25320 [Mycobacterium kiyosense]GLC02592.1 hypothetical protein SRL2020400_31830 [Mycobacterium kiyosense]